MPEQQGDSRFDLFSFYFLHQEGFFLIVNLSLFAALHSGCSYVTQTQPAPGISPRYAAYLYGQYTMTVL